MNNLDAETSHAIQELLKEVPGVTITVNHDNGDYETIRYTKSGLEIEPNKKDTEDESKDTAPSSPAKQEPQDKEQALSTPIKEDHMEPLRKEEEDASNATDSDNSTNSGTKPHPPKSSNNDVPPQPLEKNMADLAISNYEGEIIKKEQKPLDEKAFPESGYILRDKNNYITEIIMAPKKFVFCFGNDVTTTTNQYNATKIIQHGRAAPLLTLTSAFGDVAMPTPFFKNGIQAMNRNFWQLCKHVNISGSWNANVLKPITENLPGNILNVVMRRFMVLNAYRLRWLLKENLQDLRYINFDSRCTDNRDMVTNIKFMADTSRQPFTRVYLNVEGFFANMPLFAEGMQRIHKCTTENATVTVLTEQPADDKLFEMLQFENFVYAGQGECESHLEPYGMQKYDLFNKTSIQRNITFGFLANNERDMDLSQFKQPTAHSSPSDFDY